MTRKSYWQRFQSERVSRRRLLATAGLGSAGLVAAAACGGGDGEEATKTPAAGETPAAVGTPTVVGEPKPGGVYKSPNASDWGTIDPCTSVGTGTGIFPRMYNVLFSRSNADPTFVFWDLAESMEQPDEVTYVYAIRPGVKIGPNDLGIPERDLDAYDADAIWRRAEEDDDALMRAFTVPSLDSYETPDATTHIVKTKGPYAYFLSRLGRALGGCMPPREFFEQGISLQDKGVGAGPFVIRPGTYQETGEITLDRNPNYYRKSETTGLQLPYVDTIDVLRITERQARRTAFLDGQIYTYVAETIDEVNDILGQKPEIYLLRNPVFTFISFTMNVTRPPWDDERIRKAALYALDRQQFADLIFGEGEAQPNGIVHWPCGPYALPPEELEQLQPYDPQKSRDLIKAATGEDTITVTIAYPVGMDLEFHDRHLPIFLQQMRDAGFDVQEDPQDFGSWLANYTRVRYDASLSPNQIYETSEITLDWQSSLGPQQDENFAIGVGALYPEVDEALVDSKSALSTEEHIEKVREVQRLIYEKGPSFLPIVSWSSYNLYWDFVKNYPSGLGDTQTFLNESWLDL